MRQGSLALSSMTLALLTFAATSGAAQQPAPKGPELLMHPQYDRNQPVSPVFEGWYQNPDGSYTLSFGFFNRNAQESVYIPVGPNNFITPSQYDGVQNTVFPAIRTGFFGRGTGTFGVVVPADFSPDSSVVWTLTSQGRTYSVPGRIKHQEYRLSNIDQPVGNGSMPPRLRFGSDPEVVGLKGVFAQQTLQARVGVPTPVTVWAQDNFEQGRRQAMPVLLTWWVHQGPVGSSVNFVAEGTNQYVGGASLPGQPSPAAGRGGGAGAAGGGRGGGGNAFQAPAAGGERTALATFSMPGEYVLRVEARATARDSSNSDQCCWTNGYVRVVVTP